MLSKFSLATSVASASFYGHNYQASPNDDCSNFNGNVGCTSGDQTRYPDEWSKRAFQTFLPDGVDAHMYKPEYEGLGRVMCYNQAVYSPNRDSATLHAKCRKHDSIVKMEYQWGSGDFFGRCCHFDCQGH
jgi:hypothetical protein